MPIVMDKVVFAKRRNSVYFTTQTRASAWPFFASYTGLLIDIIMISD